MPSFVGGTRPFGHCPTGLLMAIQIHGHQECTCTRATSRSNFYGTPYFRMHLVFPWRLQYSEVVISLLFSLLLLKWKLHEFLHVGGGVYCRVGTMSSKNIVSIKWMEKRQFWFRIGHFLRLIYCLRYFFYSYLYHWNQMGYEEVISYDLGIFFMEGFDNGFVRSYSE